MNDPDHQAREVDVLELLYGIAQLVERGIFYCCKISHREQPR